MNYLISADFSGQVSECQIQFPDQAEVIALGL